MNNRVLRPARQRGFALKELITLIAIAVVLVVLLLPFLAARNRANRRNNFYCYNNLMRIGLALRLWAEDNNDKFPMEVPISLGGTLEYTNGTDTYRHFQVMSNELSSPKIVNCPNDDRLSAADFASLSNSNVSYFVNLDAKDDSGFQMLFSGDRNITGATRPTNGILALKSGDAAGWTTAIHHRAGYVLMADGNLQGTTGADLTEILKASGAPTNTWRISLPE